MCFANDALSDDALCDDTLCDDALCDDNPRNPSMATIPNTSMATIPTPSMAITLATLAARAYRDLPLRGSLCDGTHVDSRVGHRLGERGADARPERHPLTDDRDDRVAVLDGDRSNLFPRQLHLELVLQRTERLLGKRLFHSDADARIRRRLPC